MTVVYHYKLKGPAPKTMAKAPLTMLRTYAAPMVATVVPKMKNE